MLNPLPPLFTSEDAVALHRATSSERKRRNAESPTMGRDATWAQMIAIYEGVVIDTLTRLASAPKWSKLELIGARRVIDHAFRCASEPPSFYAGALYVSGGRLAQIARWRAACGEGPGGPAIPRGIVEHVLPLATFASGTRVLKSPAAELPQARRALLGPVCVITREENARLATKTHPDPERPFLRYAGIADVYRTTDGTRLDPDHYTFADHAALMRSVPAYASGAALLDTAAKDWAAALKQSGYTGTMRDL
ncbi:hypothetical protein [Sphingomonas sp.]|uniref:hypothetical protein n=1 Tax=Sphingomonas sp. TaxID=28214 RepID=UPI0035C7903B